MQDSGSEGCRVCLVMSLDLPVSAFRSFTPPKCYRPLRMPFLAHEAYRAELRSAKIQCRLSAPSPHCASTLQSQRCAETVGCGTHPYLQMPGHSPICARCARIWRTCCRLGIPLSQVFPHLGKASCQWLHGDTYISPPNLRCGSSSRMDGLVLFQ